MNTILCYFVASVISLASLKGIEEEKFTFGVKQITEELVAEEAPLCEDGEPIYVTVESIKAPTKVPKACAKKGVTKCLASNKCIFAFKLSISAGFIPSGNGIKLGPYMMIPILTALPITKPKITANTFLTIFMVQFFLKV